LLQRGQKLVVQPDMIVENTLRKAPTGKKTVDGWSTKHVHNRMETSIN